MEKLLITGATGFLGGAVLEKIINSSTYYEILLLVRAQSYDEAVIRIKDNMRKFNIKEEKLSTITSQQILLGDLAHPESFINDYRLDSINYVINCAAVASFSNNPLIWKVNVEGTLTFSRRMSQVKSLKKFLHIGTAMSSTPEPNSLVLENIEYKESTAHLVEYTHSKSIIEHLIRESCPNMPLLIARPSIIVGHTQHGCQPSSSIFWVFRMGLMLKKFMCSLEDRIDVIPVDYCANAILLLISSNTRNGDVFHISAGEDSSVQFRDIDYSFARAMESHPVEGSYTQVNYETLVKMRHELKGIFGPCNERLMLKAMYLYGKFASLNVIFSNNKLRDIGMPPSPRFTDYIDRCLLSTRNLSIPEQMKIDFK